MTVVLAVINGVAAGAWWADVAHDHGGRAAVLAAVCFTVATIGWTVIALSKRQERRP